MAIPFKVVLMITLRCFTESTHLIGWKFKLISKLENGYLNGLTLTVQLSYKVTSTCESLARNLCASGNYTEGYSPVEGLRGLKLVQDFN